MVLEVGAEVPDVALVAITGETQVKVSTAELLGRGKVVLFAVPGAFTPTCSDYHLPGFVIRSEEIKAKGVDLIACIAVNDVFVMAAWGKSQGIGDEVTLLADGSGEFAKAAGLELDLGAGGLGTRSQRYAMILQDGIVTSIEVEPGAELTVASAEAVLAKL